MPDYSDVLTRFELCRPGARDGLWNVRCPCLANHKNGDRNPSARVWVDEETQQLRFWCAKGCKWLEAVEATGSRKRDWFPPKDKRDRQRWLQDRARKMNIVATYDYRDESGHLLFQVCRTDPKSFLQRRPVLTAGEVVEPGKPPDWLYSLSAGKYFRNPTGEWLTAFGDQKDVLELGEVRRVPYQLPALNTDLKQPVLIPEGEKDVDCLRELGFTATCNAGGAKKWPFGFGGFLCGRRVVVLADADLVGIEHACQVATSCMAYGCESLRILRWAREHWSEKDVPEGADVSDWMKTVDVKGLDPGGIKDKRRKAFAQVVKRVPEWRAAV